MKATPKKRGRKSNAQKKAEAEAEEAALLANIAEEPEPEEAKDDKAVAKEPERWKYNWKLNLNSVRWF